MKVEFTKEEMEFLIEALKYAEISFDGKISQYPEEQKTNYRKEFYQAKKKMFNDVSKKLKAAKNA